MNHKPNRPFQAGLLLIAINLVLAGCGNAGSDNPESFVARLKAHKSSPIKPPSVLATPEDYVYRPQGRRLPFTPWEAREKTVRDVPRPRQSEPLGPLERYPLDALQMVGTISAHGATFGLIEAPDHITYLVAVGDHLGRRHGVVQGIRDTSITLIEPGHANNGGYQKRRVVLAPTQ